MQRLVIGVLDEVDYIDKSCLWLFTHPACHIFHVPVCEEIIKLSDLWARYGKTWISWHIYLLINHRRHVGAADHVWVVIILIFFVFIDLDRSNLYQLPISFMPIETTLAHSWLSNKSSTSSPLQRTHWIVFLTIAARSFLVTACLRCWDRLTRGFHFFVGVDMSAHWLHTIHALTQHRVQGLCHIASERFKFIKGISFIINVECHEVIVIGDHSHVSDPKALLERFRKRSPSLAHSANMITAAEEQVLTLTDNEAILFTLCLYRSLIWVC